MSRPVNGSPKVGRRYHGAFDRTTGKRIGEGGTAATLPKGIDTSQWRAELADRIGGQLAREIGSLPDNKGGALVADLLSAADLLDRTRPMPKGRPPDDEAMTVAQRLDAIVKLADETRTAARIDGVDGLDAGSMMHLASEAAWLVAHADALRAASRRVGAALHRCSLEAGFYAEMGVSDESDAAIDEAVSALAALGVQAGPA